MTRFDLNANPNEIFKRHDLKETSKVKKRVRFWDVKWVEDDDTA